MSVVSAFLLVAAPAHSAYPNKIVSIGDSITAGFDMEWYCGSSYPDCPEWNWSTGIWNTNSHYRKLKTLNSYLTQASVAKSGARFKDFPGQATNAVSHRPDYVTVMLGGNDICRDKVSDIPSNSTIDYYFRTGMNTLLQNGVKDILVVGIPDGETLYNTAFWKYTREGLLCNQLWYNLSLSGNHYCQTWLGAEITSNPLDSCFYNPFTCDRAKQRRAAATSRRNSINSLLQTVTGQYASSNPGRRIKYISFSTGFTTNDINNIDCFHPSKAGQYKLGGDTFSRGITFP